MSFEYLNICFSYYSFTLLTTGSKKSTQKVLLNASFCLALLAEQQETVRWVEALFQKCDHIEALYQKAKAFRGELVPQDPNDEPAEVLLERLKAEKATAQPQKKPPQPQSKKGKA